MINKQPTPRRVSVSSWAVHPALGRVYSGRPGDADASMMASGEGDGTTLLDVPARLAALGIHTMEVCHFHLPANDSDYLADLRGAIEAAGVEMWSLLVDDGDITHPENGNRDKEWVAGWIDAAAALGAKRARVIAGKQPPTEETLERSRAALSELADYAAERNVRLVTENWFPLLSRPQPVHWLLEALDGAVGFNFDFGNWGGPTKYDDLAAIAPLAETSHAKCDYPAPGQPDTEDFTRCLEITRAADYSGPYTLVNADRADLWNSLAAQRDLIALYL